MCRGKRSRCPRPGSIRCSSRATPRWIDPMRAWALWARFALPTLLVLPAFAETSGELRARWDDRSVNERGPLADANALVPGIAPATPGAAVAEAELRGRWRMLSANVLLASEHPEGGPTRSFARFNELHASGDLGAWQASAGKKIAGWGVGYGFRPNDFVQQEERRTLLPLTQEGRPLLQAEHFDSATGTSALWVNPQRLNDADDEQRFARESALAA